MNKDKMNNLAPRLERPLSWSNPLDYLRLLYWLLYFPQALPWYLENFGGGLGEFLVPTPLHPKLNHPIKRRLFLQGLILMLVIPCILGLLLQIIGLTISWTTLLQCLVFPLPVYFGFFWITSNMVAGMAIGISFTLVAPIGGILEGTGIYSTTMDEITAYRLILLICYSLFSLSLNIVGATLAFNRDISTYILSILGITGFYSLCYGYSNGLVWGILFTAAFTLPLLRQESWLWGSLISNFTVASVTPLPLINLSEQLQNELEQNWEQGLEYCEKVLKYSLQFMPVFKAVQVVLASTPSEEIMSRVSFLAENPRNWNLLLFAATSPRQKLKWILGNLLCLSSSSWFTIQPHGDTPVRAATAGFWYLHNKKPQQAAAAVATIRGLPQVEEIFIFARTLAVLPAVKEAKTIVQILVLLS